MSQSIKDFIKKTCKECKNDRMRVMDVVIAVQKEFGSITNKAIDLIAKHFKTNRVEIEGVVSFYSFLSKDQKGNVVIRLCNDVVDKMKGYDAVASAFMDELGIGFNETTDDAKITLEHTPCIGMCDQAPAALINDVMFPSLTPQKAKEIVSQLKSNPDPAAIAQEWGDGNNAHDLIKSAVKNNIYKKGPVILAEHEAESGLKKALSWEPKEIIEEIKISKLRGRGGAGFPTGMKWEFTASAKGDKKVVMCNADEGEPGTFKDRVLLTEYSHLVFEGMTIGGYAIGADTGIMYLRGEYAYLRKFLENVLNERRKNRLLGKNILGKKGFDFDIRIQSGAGAYICGEETALISSSEGLRGDPKNRPPFPAQKGYMGKPTTVNNVETFCSVARILVMGAAQFAGLGTRGSTGTKLLSISGDCEKPGVYEFEFGTTINDLLKETGASDTQAVLVAGPSGQIIGPNDFGKKICYDELATGGAIVIFDTSRNLLEIIGQYMDFFIEESCGYCTPCRAGNILLKKKLEEILAGKGVVDDIAYLEELGKNIRLTSRCGLGQTSPNPILSTIKNFRGLYEDLLLKDDEGMVPSFDINKALAASEGIAGRKSKIFKS